MIRRLAVGLAAAALALGSLATVGLRPVAGADTITFGSAAGSSKFNDSITFTQDVDLGSATIRRAEVLLGFPTALGPLSIEVPGGAGLSGSTTLRFSWDVATDGHLVPNTTLQVAWRITTAGGTVATGPNLTYRYSDDRFDWRIRTGSLVRVHWYQGDAAFGERALSIAQDGVRKAEDLLGVTETDPIDFYVYADQSAFYDALGPGTRENVGGEAHADIRTLFALITPDAVNDPWVGVVLPHELTHLVFNSAVANPYHFPPRWLNEGLAVYLSAGLGGGDRDRVAAAAQDGTLAPLSSLAGAFPTNQDRFYLAYAESVSAVDFLVRKYGKSVLVKLIRSYSDGLTDDEALQAAIGLDVNGFDAAWRNFVGAQPMASTGPQPAPAGPLPSEWTGPPPAGATSGPATPSAAPAGSQAPDVTPSPSASAAPASGGGLSGAVVVGFALLVAVVVVVLVVLRSRVPPRAP